MADTPDPNAPQDQIDYRAIMNNLVLPQIAAWERVQKAISGQEDSLADWLTNKPNGVGDRLRAMTEELSTTWNGQGPAIGPRLEEQLWRLGNTISDPNYGLSKVILDQFGNVTRILQDPASPPNSELRRSIDALTATWQDPLNPPTADLTASLRGIHKSLGNDGPEIPASLGEQLKKLLGIITTHPPTPANPLGPLVGMAADIMKWASEKLPEKGQQVGMESAANAIGSILGATSAQQVAQGWAGLFMEAIGEGVAEEAFGAIQSKFAELFAKVIEDMQANIEAVPGGTEDEVLRRAGTALTDAMGWGISAHIVALGFELMHPLKAIGVNQIAGFLADMGAFQPISHAIWGNMVDAAISRPLNQAYNQKFPTRIPPFGEILAMARKHEYDTNPADERGIPSGYLSDMAKQGIPDMWVDRFWHYQWADPRLYDIIRIMDVDMPALVAAGRDRDECARYAVDPDDPDWWLRLKFKKGGYDSTDLNVLVKVARARGAATDRTRVITQLRNTYRQGYMVEDQFRAELAAMNQDQDSINLMVTEVGYQRAHDRAQDYLTLFGSSFDQDRMNPDDFAASVSYFIPDAQVAQDFIGLHTQKRLITVGKAEDTSVNQAVRQLQSELVTAYRNQYRAGLIDEGQLLAALLVAGVSNELAGAIQQNEIARRLPRFNPDRLSPEQLALNELHDQLQRAYIAQYHAGLLDEEQLRTSLITIGRSPDFAGALVATEMARKIGALHAKKDAESQAAFRRLQAAFRTAMVNQYRKDLIEAPAFYRGLVQALIPDAEAKALVVAEQARKGELGELPFQDPAFHQTAPTV